MEVQKKNKKINNKFLCKIVSQFIPSQIKEF